MLTRKLMVLKCDVKNPKPKSRACGYEADDVIEKGAIFAHEICTDDVKGGKAETLVDIDPESLQPIDVHNVTTDFFKLIMPNLRRAKPSLARVLHENDIHAPVTVMNVFHRLIKSGVVKLADVEREVKAFKSEIDADIDPGFEDQVTTPKAKVSKPKGMRKDLKSALLNAVKKAGTMDEDAVIGALPKKINSEDSAQLREFMSYCSDYDVLLTAKNIDAQYRAFIEEAVGV